MCYHPDDTTDPRFDDAERDPAPRRRYRCADGFCGADDCDRCHPGHDEE